MATQSSTNTSKAAADHGWFGTETVETRAGNFEFKNSYPSRGTRDATAGDAHLQPRGRGLPRADARRLLVSRVERSRGCGAKTPNQVVLWENLMDGATLLLTGNSETVYGLCADRLEARRAGRDRSAGRSARRPVRPVAARDHGHRPDRRRQGQGRQVPAAAPGPRRRRARRLYGREVADLQCGASACAAFSRGRRDGASGRADEDRAESIRLSQAANPPATTSSSTARARRSTRFSPTPASTSPTWPAMIEPSRTK